MKFHKTSDNLDYQSNNFPTKTSCIDKTQRAIDIFCSKWSALIHLIRIKYVMSIREKS
ncbi:MAG: hypothetical protein LBH74_07050 [Nitrososphaerota archaeon]|nr:hypothetical protein [Nitrososphaerota archaeon]